MQALVEIKRAEKCENGFPGQPEPSRESLVGGSGPGKGAAVDRVRNDRDLVARDAARGHVVPEALTNRRHRIDAAQSIGFEKSCGSIARTICALGAAAPRGVFPERAHFINYRQPMPATGADRRERVE